MAFPRLEEVGFELVRAVFSASETAALLEDLPAVPAGTAGSRDLHELPWMRDFATGSAMSALAREAIGDAARAVRILFFDKQPGSNWKLPYHQDLTIAVASRVEVDGYGPWSVKDGIVHVQPPVAVLERMVAVRLHLDECRADNGALRAVPGSHRRGKLPVADTQPGAGEQVLEAAVGDVLLMKPLVLHASSPAVSASHRRVLHIEYCAAGLAEPLRWFLGWPTS